MEKGGYILVGFLAVLIALGAIFFLWQKPVEDETYLNVLFVSSGIGLLVSIVSIFSVAGLDSSEIFQHMLNVVLFALNILIIVLGMILIYFLLGFTF